MFCIALFNNIFFSFFVCVYLGMLVFFFPFSFFLFSVCFHLSFSFLRFLTDAACIPEPDVPPHAGPWADTSPYVLNTTPSPSSLSLPSSVPGRKGGAADTITHHLSHHYYLSFCSVKSMCYEVFVLSMS